MAGQAEKFVDLVEPLNAEAFARVGGSASVEHLFTAKMQHAHLEDALKAWGVDRASQDSDVETVPVEQFPAAPPNAAPAAQSNQEKPALAVGVLTAVKTSTIVKSALALLVALTLGWIPVQRMLVTTSAQAVINARVITVRTPISGEVDAQAAQLAAGTPIHAGDALLTVTNVRSDRTNLDNLERTVQQLTTNISALRAKEVVLERHHAELIAQNDRFRAGRIETLTRQIGENDAQLASASAEHSDAEQSLTRSRALFAKGIVAQAYLDKAIRDERVASETVNQLRERRKATEAGLAFARQGTFITDGYNDTTQSLQRSLAVEVELADVGARLAGTMNELASVKQNLIEEKKREQDLSAVVVRASMSGRIWETMTAPGEHVNAGQVLMRLLDCSSATVTASVSEKVFQTLTIGQAATFKPADGGRKIKGSIVDLSGLAALASNDAIQAKMLSSEPYHVTLKFPDLARRSQCQISRAGLVTFDTSSPHEAAVARIGAAK